MPKSDYQKKIQLKKAQGLVAKAKVILLPKVGIFDQPDPAYVLGIDTSHWTGVVDWQAAKAGGIQFAIIKFMDGKTRSRFAEENYRGAKDAGVLVGAYQWLRSAKEGAWASPAGQAREYLAMLADHPCDIRPAVDYEWSPLGKKYNADMSDLQSWHTAFYGGYGKLGMIYTAPGYWNQYSGGAGWAQNPLWAAQYKVRLPDRFGPWPAWKFWQFTGTGDGSKYGVPADGEKAVDLNYWCGTLADLQAWAKG